MIFGLVLILAHLELINLDLESVKQFTSSLRANDKLLQSKALEIIEKIRNRTFRNKSHMVEYALFKLLNGDTSKWDYIEKLH